MIHPCNLESQNFGTPHNLGTRHPSYTLAARRAGIPCPQILRHGTLVKHSFMWSEIPCPKNVGHGAASSQQACWRSGHPCPNILGHGTLAKHSFMRFRIPCPKVFGPGTIVKQSDPRSANPCPNSLGHESFTITWAGRGPWPLEYTGRRPGADRTIGTASPHCPADSPASPPHQIIKRLLIAYQDRGEG